MEEVQRYLHRAGFETVASQSDKHHMVLGVATKLAPEAATALKKPVFSTVSSLDTLVRRHAPVNFVALLLIKGSVASVRYSGPKDHATEVANILTRLQPGTRVNKVLVKIKG